MKFYRWLLALIALLFFSPLASGSSFRIRDIIVQPLTRDDFSHLLKIPCRARHFVYRTDDSNLNGPYFQVFCNHPISHLPNGSFLLLELYCDGDESCHKIEVPLQNVSLSSREIWLGLTDEKRAKLKVKDFLSWRLSIYDSEKQLLARRKSFLFVDHGQKPTQKLTSN